MLFFYYTPFYKFLNQSSIPIHGVFMYIFMVSQFFFVHLKFFLHFSIFSCIFLSFLSFFCKLFHKNDRDFVIKGGCNHRITSSFLSVPIFFKSSCSFCIGQSNRYFPLITNVDYLILFIISYFS